MIVTIGIAIRTRLLALVLMLLNSTHPVREAFHRHGWSYRGLFHSRKSFDGHPIPFESALARDFLRVCELSAEVLLVFPEPGTITYVLDGVEHQYTPDYLVHMRGGIRGAIEIKPQWEASLPHNQRCFEAIREVFALADAPFLVITDAKLRAPVLQANLAQLEAQRHFQLSARALGNLLLRTGRGNATFSELVALAGGDRRLVLAAIAQGYLGIDLSKPIDTAIVWRV